MSTWHHSMQDFYQPFHRVRWLKAWERGYIWIYKIVHSLILKPQWSGNEICHVGYFHLEGDKLLWTNIVKWISGNFLGYEIFVNSSDTSSALFKDGCVLEMTHPPTPLARSVESQGRCGWLWKLVLYWLRNVISVLVVMWYSEIVLSPSHYPSVPNQQLFSVEYNQTGLECCNVIG